LNDGIGTRIPFQAGFELKLPVHSWEAVGLGAGGICLLLLSLPGVLQQVLDPAQNAYLWRRAGVLGQLLFAYGMFFFFLGLWSAILRARGSSLRDGLQRRFSEIRVLLQNDLWRGARRACLPEAQVRWLLVVLCVGVGIRGYFLAQPMRYDESNTFLHFVNGDVLQMFFYPFPNNHVFHTILVKFTTAVLGAHPATIRLPAFVAGVASIPLIFCVARVLLPERSPVFASVAMAIFPYVVLYSTTARGYTLMVLFTLLLVLVGALTARRPSKAASTILAIIAALGILTLPSMAFPVAGVYLWLASVYLIQGHTLRGVVRDFIAPCAFLTAGVTAVLYTPVILVSEGVAAVVSNKYVAAQSSEKFFTRLPHHLLETIGDFSRDVPGPVLVFGLALMAI
jgi:hypothetical protein